MHFASRFWNMGKKSRIEVRTGAILTGALALLILPLSFLVSFVIAGAFHEVCHWLALQWAGISIYNIHIGPFGATMETEPMEAGREVLCTLAGPLGSFLLIPGYHIFPEIAICALIQGAFNLLPVYPLDGGRILRGILEILKIPGREWICAVIQWLTALAISALCLYGFLIWNLGFGVLILGLAVAYRAFPRKTPCKEAFFGVQ